MFEQIPFRTIEYQWETFLYSPKIKPKQNYENTFGYKVLTRDSNGIADEINFSIYFPENCNIYIVGEFNEWGKCKKQELEKFRLEKIDDFYSIKLNNLKHKEQYLYLINGIYLRDPATILFDQNGNSIFWDFDDPSTYKLKNNKPERLHRATKIIQTDVVGLVAKWFEYDKKSKMLSESEDDLFTFIKNCGVLEKIKELGFNTIQFLPTSQSIDGDNWKFRYLVAYPYAIHKSFGNPDSFLALIDKCHELGLAVIIDLVISHCPNKNFKLFYINGEDVGLNNWKLKNNNSIFLDETTSWGTRRYAYHNEFIKNYLIESSLLFLTKYFVDGFRIDNVDGILRFEEHGDGKDRPGGREFLQKLIKSCYEYDSECLIHLESHYFYGDNAKNLVVPFSFSKQSLGATAYNDSRITYFLHSEFMPKSADKISIWTLENIRKEKEWGKSNSTIVDFHNHDAAAGLMYGRATGSYAFDALTLNDPQLKSHAIGKIKVMESFIAFGCEGRILDLLQTFLLQKGTFEHDCSIHWNDLNINSSKQVVLFKKQINVLLDRPAFWPENNINRNYTNVDETNKILVISRFDTTQNSFEKYYILINFSGAKQKNYCFGVEENKEFEMILNSECEKIESKKYLPKSSSKFEFFSKEIELNEIEPYQILIFRTKLK